MKLYLESSALVKIFRLEPHSDQMIALISLIDGERSWAAFSSKWSLIEIARALKKDRKPKEIIMLDLKELGTHKIKFLSVTDDLIKRAREIVAYTNLYAADALHLLTFEKINRKERLDGFVCDDYHYGRFKDLVPVKRAGEVIQA